MKRLLLLLAVLPTLVLGAVAPNALQFQQYNSTGTALAPARVLTPDAGTSFTTMPEFRTAIGLGTAASPTFTGLTLSGATASTLASFNGSKGVVSITTSAALDLIGTTQGSILYRNGSTWVLLTPGTSGQVLQTQGAAANPQWATVSGTGDVVGPASATDNAIARFDSTTGKLIQNSAVTIADTTGAVTITGAGGYIGASLTGQSATDLTLSGGSSGASLVLGQGASGIGTFNRNVYTSGGALLAAGNIGSPGSIGLVGFIDTSAGLVRFGAYNFTTAAWQPLTLNSGGGNVLIGGTTDISGSGGLKVFGATAATSTTTGALQVAGGGSVQGAWYVGADATVTGDLTVSGGNVGVGGVPIAASALILRGSSLLTGTTQVGLDAQTTFSSAATTAARSVTSIVITAASGFTVNNAYAYYADTPSIGAASAITNNTGLFIANQGASGITNAYGIDIAAQSGAATTNVGLRNAGLTILTNATEATTGGAGSITSSGGAYFTKKLITASSLTTGNPASGTAAEWKLGSVVTGVTSTFVTTEYLQVDVGGVLKKIGLITSVP